MTCRAVHPPAGHSDSGKDPKPKPPTGRERRRRRRRLRREGLSFLFNLATCRPESPGAAQGPPTNPTPVSQQGEREDQEEQEEREEQEEQAAVTAAAARTPAVGHVRSGAGGAGVYVRGTAHVGVQGGVCSPGQGRRRLPISRLLCRSRGGGAQSAQLSPRSWSGG